MIAALGISVAGCAETKYMPIELNHSKPERPDECRTREALPLLPADGEIMPPEAWERLWLAALAVQRRNKARDAMCQHYDHLIEGLRK